MRYLQDNVIAYQDQAWGDGEILLNYRCTPGKPVDRYRSGHKTHILVSRRQVKNKGDVDEFNIEWDIRGGFLRSTEQWETHVQHKTAYLKINVIFPKARPPQRVTLFESNRQRSQHAGRRAPRRCCQMAAGGSRGRQPNPDCTRTTSFSGSGRGRERRQARGACRLSGL